jgi:hypothetical protein
VWHWVKQVSGIFLTVCFCLYVIRCASKFEIVSLDEFEHFFNGLVHYIFA